MDFISFISSYKYFLQRAREERKRREIEKRKQKEDRRRKEKEKQLKISERASEKKTSEPQVQYKVSNLLGSNLY